ncbi:MAG: RNA polymerase subunit sigma [Planctomycetaceae bacterium]|nr:RNA polymerase subunit sigma [Planctomycetaceae bacterium]
MNDVTLILQQIEQGDLSSTEELLPLVYDELRQLAAGQMFGERPDHTLQPTALVNEAYLRLLNGDEIRHWESRRHFFGAAAEAMRRILVDHARRQLAQKRGGKFRRVLVDELASKTPADPAALLDLDEAVLELAEDDPDAAELVKLRLFAGLTVTEAGELLGLSRTTAYRSWDFVRIWFSQRSESLAD